MSIGNILRNSIARREFLKAAGKAALAASTGLDSLIACAPTLSALHETKEDVANVKWECNPMIPIPNDKICTGTNSRIPVEILNDYWKTHYGIGLTFHHPTWGSYDGMNDAFPTVECQKEIEQGVIPVVRYVVLSKPFDGFNPIANGKFDDDIKKFAHQAAKFEHPIILMPFEQLNTTSRMHKIY